MRLLSDAKVAWPSNDSRRSGNDISQLVTEVDQILTNPSISYTDLMIFLDTKRRKYTQSDIGFVVRLLLLEAEGQFKEAIGSQSHSLRKMTLTAVNECIELCNKERMKLQNLFNTKRANCYLIRKAQGIEKVKQKNCPLVAEIVEIGKEFDRMSEIVKQCETFVESALQYDAPIRWVV
jgi:hypothetical protein